MFWAAYGMVWLFGDLRALRLRRTFLRSDTLHLRLGTRLQTTVSLPSIRSVRAYVAADASTDGFSKLTVMGDPRFVLELTEPAEIIGPFGRTREASWLGIALDDDALMEAIAAKVTSRSRGTH